MNTYIYTACIFIFISTYIYSIFKSIYFYVCISIQISYIYIYIHIGWRIHPRNRGCSEFRSKMPSTLYHQSDLFGAFVWESGTSKCSPVPTYETIAHIHSPHHFGRMFSKNNMSLETKIWGGTPCWWRLGGPFFWVIPILHCKIIAPEAE